MTGPLGVVVTVGDELTSGVNADTNGGEVARRLASLGIPVLRLVSVRDSVEEIAAVVRDAFASGASTVVTTGGLGPTTDDVTREALAAVAGVAVESRPELVDRLIARYGRELATGAPQLRQATAPVGARVLDNPVGSAPGLAVDCPGGVAYALPGPPQEMRAVLTSGVVPELLDRFPSRPASVLLELRCAGIAEAEVGRRVEGLGSLAPVAVAYLAGAGEVRVRLGATGPSVDDAQRLATAAGVRVRELLGADCYAQRWDDGLPDPATTLEATVVALLRARDETVATAESLTAGLVSARLANVPGVSAVLRGGVTSYATDVKGSVLGVPADVLAAHGAVSEETVGLMAAGARTLLGATWGVATSGVAGPDPQEGQPAGTLCLGVAGPGGVVTRRVVLPDGGRDWLRRTATTMALDLLRRSLR